MLSGLVSLCEIPKMDLLDDFGYFVIIPPFLFLFQGIGIYALDGQEIRSNNQKQRDSENLQQTGICNFFIDYNFIEFH